MLLEVSSPHLLYGHSSFPNCCPMSILVHNQSLLFEQVKVLVKKYSNEFGTEPESQRSLLNKTGTSIKQNQQLMYLHQNFKVLEIIQTNKIGNNFSNFGLDGHLFGFLDLLNIILMKHMFQNFPYPHFGSSFGWDRVLRERNTILLRLFMQVFFRANQTVMVSPDDSKWWLAAVSLLSIVIFNRMATLSKRAIVVSKQFSKLAKLVF